MVEKIIPHYKVLEKTGQRAGVGYKCLGSGIGAEVLTETETENPKPKTIPTVRRHGGRSRNEPKLEALLVF